MGTLSDKVQRFDRAVVRKEYPTMRFLLMLALGLAVAASAAALTPGTSAAASSEITDAIFGAIEKKIIKDFFGGGEKKAKKNKGKSGEMPPGLARHIERYGTLPPGLAKKSLPPGLADRLPATKAGQKRVIVGNDVVLVQAATGVILDIIKDVVRDRDK